MAENKFVADREYEHAGKKIKVGTRGARKCVVVDGKEISVTGDSEAGRLVNPLNPYESHATLEDVANAIADELSK